MTDCLVIGSLVAHSSLRSSHHDKLEIIPLRVEQRHCFHPRTVQGAGVDDASAANALIPFHMGMPVHDVVVPLRRQSLRKGAAVVAVCDIERFAAQIYLAAGAETLDFKVCRIALQ